MTDKKKITIYSLKPDEPHFCSPDDDVQSASISMANHRVHCVLVNDEYGVLIGLFTAKDLTFRVIGHSLNPQTTKVKDIMTTTPLCLHMDTPITEALETMVERGVRHLPLLDDHGSIKGVLDITRCFHQAMLRIERINSTALKLKEVLSDVAYDYEHIHSLEAQRIVNDVKRLSGVIEVPTLESVLEKSGNPSFIDSSDSILSAAENMITNQTTALLVRDRTSSSRKVIGIFTSKDICYRVLARGLDPRSCTVARVLTTSPEFAKSDMNIGAALRQMYQGHYLNLPVMDFKTNEIISVVSVLKLTYAALHQLSQSESLDQSSFGSTTLKEVTNRLGDDRTPVWDMFWNSLEKSFDDMHSLEFSVASKSPAHSRSQTPNISSHRSSQTQTSLTNLRHNAPNDKRALSDIDSRSNFVRSPRFKRVVSAEALTRTSFYMRQKSIIFKVNFNSEETHKIKMIVSDEASIYDDIKLLELLKHELNMKVDDFNTKCYDLFYYDEKNDLVFIADESDLIEAIKSSGQRDNSVIELVVRDKSKATGSSNLAKFWEFLNKCKVISQNNSSNIVGGTLAVVCIGVILGFSWCKGTRLWVR